MLRQMHGQKVSTCVDCSIAIDLSLPAQAWQRHAAKLNTLASFGQFDQV